MAYAKDKSFTIVSAPYSDYDYDLKIMDLDTGKITNIAHTGKHLKDYLIKNIPISKFSINNGTVKWENPNYKIVDGMQTVNMIYTDAITNKSLTFAVYLKGASYLNANSITMDKDCWFDVNICGKIPNCKYTWTSSNKNVASVDSSGLVAAKHYGSTDITCKIIYPDKTIKTLKCNVTVAKNTSKYELTDTSLNLSVNENYDINILNKSINSDYLWMCDNDRLLDLNHANGMITALKNGKTKIMCAIRDKDYNVVVLSCKINIK